MVHSGEKSIKVKLALLDTHDGLVESLGLKLKEYHKEQVTFNNKVNALMYDDLKEVKLIKHDYLRLHPFLLKP